MSSEENYQFFEEVEGDQLIEELGKITTLCKQVVRESDKFFSYVLIPPSIELDESDFNAIERYLKILKENLMKKVKEFEEDNLPKIPIENRSLFYGE